MIKITHINGDEKLVTKGAFESIFEPLGYKKVVEKDIKQEKVALTEKNEFEKQSDIDEFEPKEKGKRK